MGDNRAVIWSAAAVGVGALVGGAVLALHSRRAYQVATQSRDETAGAGRKHENTVRFQDGDASGGDGSGTSVANSVAGAGSDNASPKRSLQRARLAKVQTSHPLLVSSAGARLDAEELQVNALPIIIAVGGASGSGKTSVADAIRQKTGHVVSCHVVCEVRSISNHL